MPRTATYFSDQYRTRLVLSAPRSKTQGRILKALNANATHLNQLYATGGHRAHTLARAAREDIKEARDLGEATSLTPEQVKYFAEESTLVSFLEKTEELTDDTFWQTLEASEAEKKEAIATIKNSWMKHGQYAHFRTSSLIETYSILENSKQQLIFLYNNRRNGLDKNYTAHFKEDLAAIEKEQQSIEWGIYYRICDYLDGNSSGNPSQLTHLFRKLQPFNAARSLSMPVNPTLESFPITAAIAICLNQSKLRARLLSLLALPASGRFKNITLLERQEAPAIFVPEALVLQIPSTRRSFWLSWFPQPHREFCYDWFARNQDLLIKLSGLSNKPPAAPTWDINDAYWRELSDLSTTLNNKLDELSGHKTPLFFYKKSKHFIQETTVFCSEQHRALIEKRISRLEAIVALPQPVDVEMGTISAFTKPFKDEITRLRHDIARENRNIRFEQFPYLKRLNIIERTLEKKSLAATLCDRLNDTLLAFEKNHSQRPDLFKRLIAQLSSVRQLSIAHRGELHQQVVPFLQEIRVRELNNWADYWAFSRSDLPDSAALNQCTQLIKKIKYTSKFDVNQEPIIKPLHRLFGQFKIYCKNVSPEQYLGQQELIHEQLDLLSNILTELPESRDRDDLYADKLYIKECVESLERGACAETAEEAQSHSLTIAKYVSDSKQIFDDGVERRKNTRETFSTVLANNYKTLQGQSVSLFSASHYDGSPKTAPITKDYDDDGVSPIKFN